MKIKSINFKLLALIITAFLLTAVSVVLLADRQTHKIIDKSQNEVYMEKLDSITGFLSRNYKSLQDTLMVEAYEEQFISQAIKVVQNDYADNNKNIHPFIIDATGHIVMHPKFARGTNLNNLEFIKQLLTQKNGDFNYSYNGQQKWLIFKNFEAWNWFVGYEIPLEVKYADSYQIRNMLILIFSVTAAVIVSALSIILTRFTKPIIELTNISSEMAAGKLDCQININRNDEVGVLASSFEKMRLAVKEKISLIEQKNVEQTQTLEQLKNEISERKKAEQKLAKINRELEGIVNARTANLVEIVEKLRCEITERERAQASLEQSEKKLQKLNSDLANAVSKLEESNNELKHFVYIASHDLREPLRTISSFGSLLEKSLNQNLGPDDAQSLHYMIDGAKRMGQMIEGLLSYSRISSKGHNFENVEINNIIGELKQYELNVLLKETHTIINIPKPLPAVKADSLQIRQLFQNLIANGIKYQPKGKTPEITITSKSAAHGMVRIEVADNGIGIPPEYHSAIFAMFKRLHNKKEYEGAGIGLSICQKIILLHNGKIGVESQLGKGSTFWFTVPAANSTAIINQNIQTTEKT
jgi:signal transduction histidine kinase